MLTKGRLIFVIAVVVICVLSTSTSVAENEQIANIMSSLDKALVSYSAFSCQLFKE